MDDEVVEPSSAAADASPQEGLASSAAADGSPDPSQDSGEETDPLLDAEARCEEYLALAQRTQADFENYRKRMAREVGASEARGVTKLAKELLPALDNLQRALAAAGAGVDGERAGAEPAGAGAEPEPDPAADTEASLARGIALVQAELMAALGRLGIQPVSPLGEPFDPNQHEAMAQQPVDGAPSGTVAEVYQPGYRLGETIIRPARVLVAA
ncbi:MAG TPA: nucleotide exchange factor GrpE [Solirubrobacteraceae bacterium]|nr:nucleotide exchange factor GrpE [Solirubrobacteraceae bacterium]